MEVGMKRVYLNFLAVAVLSFAFMFSSVVYAEVLYDNGPLVNSEGTGDGGADESVVQTSLGLTVWGFTDSGSFRLADDFTLTKSARIDTIKFYAYQTGSTTTSTMTAVNLRIWDGTPDDPGSSVIFGDTTTNIMTDTTWTGIYRVTESSHGNTLRPIMENTVSVGIILNPGTYWLDWQTSGSLASGPFVPPITINGQTTTGNALQYNGVSWAAVMDNSSGQGFPFVIEGAPEWFDMPPAPFNTYFVDAFYYNNKIYYLGYEGTSIKVGIYDTVKGSWKAGASEPTPSFAYFYSGCLGLNGTGQPVIVLFPDNSSGVLHRYNIATNSWDTPAAPSGFPVGGQWGHDIVSMINHTGQNVCYISGGSTGYGAGGNLNSLLKYKLDTNKITDLGDFTHHPAGFNVHNSWYVPWIGTKGAICVAGGIDTTIGPFSDTQCYDIGTSSFRPANSDIPPMPEPVFAAAHMWMVQGDGSDYQLWVVNGTTSPPVSNGKSMYYSKSDNLWHYGPSPISVYAPAGVTDSRYGTIYMISGYGGGSSRDYNQMLAPTNTARTVLIRPNGGDIGMGSDYTVVWSAPSAAEKFTLKYSTNGGLTWATVASGITDRFYEWTAPDYTKNKKGLFKVIGYTASDVKVGADKSDSLFRIRPVILNSPNGGEQLSSSTPTTVSWTLYKTPTTIDLYYSKDSGLTWHFITSLGPSETTYNWTPGFTGAHVRVKVNLRNGASIGNDTSDGDFKIVP